MLGHGKYLKVWTNLYKAKDAVPEQSMAQTGTTDLKKLSRSCAEWVTGLFHLSEYRAFKLKYPIDVGGIVLDERMTSELGTESLG